MFDDYTLLQTGDLIPAIKLHTTYDEELDIGPGTGNIILIHFFILDCPHCRRSLDHLGLMMDAIREHPGLQVVSVGRDHTREDIMEYLGGEHSPIIMVPDPDRNIYGLFAERKVPRFYLFDKEGKLVQQVRGYNDTEIEEVFKNISVLLDS
jgi:peroxiredoxin